MHNRLAQIVIFLHLGDQDHRRLFQHRVILKGIARRNHCLFSWCGHGSPSSAATTTAATTTAATTAKASAAKASAATKDTSTAGPRTARRRAGRTYLAADDLFTFS